MALSRKPSSFTVDALEQLFVKANNDLTYVQHKLEIEFEATHPDNVNPSKLMYRINRIQEELPLLEEQCKKLLTAKQELIDKTKGILVANRALLRRIQARSGAPICCDGDDAVYTSVIKVLQEWNSQLQPVADNGRYEQDVITLEDLNQKLFSSLIQDR